MATFQLGDRVTVTTDLGATAWVVREAGQHTRTGETLYEVEYRAGGRKRGRVIGGGVLPASHLRPAPAPTGRDDKA